MNRLVNFVLLAGILAVLAGPRLAAPQGTSVAEDPLLRMPGTQPAQAVNLEGSNRCLNCHGGNIGEGGSFIDGYGGIHGMDTNIQGADSRTG